ncbi:unnamed protein product [Pleuronectes platessa]|uniref:Uncharacterized protein n=1 Tax=Pleuronectes platessa TaxID=8262 RepID=A0A9N7Z336_PLEPL|nr:unnamed protein product [Pleuronectes platessa]
MDRHSDDEMLMILKALLHSSRLLGASDIKELITDQQSQTTGGELPTAGLDQTTGSKHMVSTDLQPEITPHPPSVRLKSKASPAQKRRGRLSFLSLPTPTAVPGSMSTVNCQLSPPPTRPLERPALSPENSCTPVSRVPSIVPLSKTVTQSLPRSLSLSICQSAVSRSLIQSVPLLLGPSVSGSFSRSIPLA